MQKTQSMHRSSPRTAWLAPFLAAAVCMPWASAAEDDIEPFKGFSKDVTTIEREIEKRKSNERKLSRETKRLAREERELKKALIDAAAVVQESEARLNTIEVRILGLRVRQNALISQLVQRRETLSSLLGALESLELSRPPALAVEPEDAVKAARSAMLLSILVPQLEAQAKELNEELKNLATVRERILAEQVEVRNAADRLNVQRKDLEQMMADLKRRRSTTTVRIAEERRRASELATEAQDLRSLLRRLEEQRVAALPREKPVMTKSEEVQTASLPPQRRVLPPLHEAYASVKKRSFPSARGIMKKPVIGNIVELFGRPNESGGRTRGVKFATRINAQVIAPFDGTIAFAGPFRGYGQLLIIEAGDGYHMLLAGMARIDGIVGQHLLAGEPIGVMGSREDAGSASGSELYVEFRKNGEPFNPLPWMAISERKANG